MFWFKGPVGWATAVSGAAANSARRSACATEDAHVLLLYSRGHRFSYSPSDIYSAGGRRTNRFHKAGSRGAWRKRFTEILRFMGYLAVPEFHDAYCVERLLVVIDDEFGDPQTAGTQNAPDFEALLARLHCAACLNVGPPANALPRLRIFENGIVAINLMLRGKIVCASEAAQCWTSAQMRLWSSSEAGHPLTPVSAAGALQVLRTLRLDRLHFTEKGRDELRHGRVNGHRPF